MDSADALVKDWHDVPLNVAANWRAIFDASTEGLDVSGNCPICGAVSLHRYFNTHKAEHSTVGGRDRIGSGSQWQWCSNCMAYEHTSGLVPPWWGTAVSVPESDLMHDPGAIETARLRARRRRHPLTCDLQEPRRVWRDRL